MFQSTLEFGLQSREFGLQWIHDLHWPCAHSLHALTSMLAKVDFEHCAGFGLNTAGAAPANGPTHCQL
jgi:hypothetical protein